MTVEEIFESRPVQFTGKTAVVLSILFNLGLSTWIKNDKVRQFFADMDLNNTFVLITSALGIIFLLIKIVSAWTAFVEKIEERVESGKRVSKFIRYITGNRKKKK